VGAAYAHHPTEVRATLAAARQVHAGRLVAVFQPHLYSRTRALAPELGRALGGADLVVVTDVYAAREAPEPGVSGRLVADAVPAGVPARYAPTLADAADVAMAEVAPGDLVLLLGAGDVTVLGQELLGRLGNDTGDARDRDEAGAAWGPARRAPRAPHHDPRRRTGRLAGRAALLPRRRRRPRLGARRGRARRGGGAGVQPPRGGRGLPRTRGPARGSPAGDLGARERHLVRRR